MTNRITIESVVDYIVTTTMEETESGNMCTYFDELSDHFKVDENFFEENFNAICDGLLSRREVCDIDGSSIEERVFDVNIWLDHCKTMTTQTFVTPQMTSSMFSRNCSTVSTSPFPINGERAKKTKQESSEMPTTSLKTK